MGYISNTDADRAEMLAAIGVGDILDLIEPIPAGIRLTGPLNIPDALDEPALVRHLQSLAARNADLESRVSFLGAGIYDHFRPSVVGAIMSRGEFATSYTPYQPELSQGMLQVIYEYQTLICGITDMELANASMYDAATAIAEAALMATDITDRNEVVVSTAVSPLYRDVLGTYLRSTGYRLVEVPATDGVTDLDALAARVSSETACVILQQPNFFGCLEDGARQIEIAHAAGALGVVSVDPISLGLLKPPGEYDADIVVGEGQSLGNPMGFGGPLLGFFACKKKYSRAFPGRIVGATVDKQGRRGYTMTLRTREQDIRREKATSNICTNQALIALCAAVFLCELGRNGLRQMADLCVQKSHYALQQLATIPGAKPAFPGARFFKEFAVRLPGDIDAVNVRLLERGIVGGLALGPYYSEMQNTMLVAVTETRTREDIDRFAAALAEIVGAS